MRVLLVAPFFEELGYPLYFPSENLGLGYLAAVLREEGVETDIVDANMLGLRAEDLPAHLGARRYDVVGVAIPFQGAVGEARRLARVAADTWPAAHVTAGGHFPTFAHVALLREDRFIRSVVRQDGEDTLRDLVLALDAGRDPEAVAGLSFKDSSGRIVVNPPRPFRADLDTLPWPARDTLRRVEEVGHLWPTQICSCRGCYAACTFCDISEFYARSWRARDPIRVVDEIEHLHREFGSRVFRFSDDQFVGPPVGEDSRDGPGRARRIAREVIERGLDVELMISARDELVTPDLFADLAAAGVVDCLVGVESGVDRILELYHKQCTVRDNEEAIRCLREVGIRPRIAFIMFDPRMTLAELRANFDFLVRNGVAGTDALRSRLWPLVGTPLVVELRRQGLVTEESLGHVGYRFADAEVGRIFGAVTECARRSFAVEQALFHAQRDGALGAAEAESLLESLRVTWVGIFGECLGGATPSDLDFVDDAVKGLEASLAEALAPARGRSRQ